MYHLTHVDIGGQERLRKQQPYPKRTLKMYSNKSDLGTILIHVGNAPSCRYYDLREMDCKVDITCKTLESQASIAVPQTSVLPTRILRSFLRRLKVPDTCTICTKTYQNIGSHMKAHTEVASKQCKVCKKSYRNLRAHMKAHAKDTSKCATCNRSYRDLHSHMKAHSMKIYSCNDCAMCYRYNKVLIRHVANYHRRPNTIL